MLRVQIKKAFARHGFDLWIYKETPQGIALAKPFELEFDQPQEVVTFPDPTTRISERDYNSIADSIRQELLTNGWTPNADILQGENKAMSNHLEDMRKLVFASFQDRFVVRGGE